MSNITLCVVLLLAVAALTDGLHNQIMCDAVDGEGKTEECIRVAALRVLWSLRYGLSHSLLHLVLKQQQVLILSSSRSCLVCRCNGQCGIGRKRT